jgi:hypothetical protein
MNNYKLTIQYDGGRYKGFLNQTIKGWAKRKNIKSLITGPTFDNLCRDTLRAEGVPLHRPLWLPYNYNVPSIPPSMFKEVPVTYQFFGWYLAQFLCPYYTKYPGKFTLSDLLRKYEKGVIRKSAGHLLWKQVYHLEEHHL